MNKKRILIVVVLIILMVATFSYFYIKNYIKCNGNNCMSTSNKCSFAYKCEEKDENTYLCHYCNNDDENKKIEDCQEWEEIIECAKPKK